MYRNTLGLYVPMATQLPQWRAALLAAVSGDSSLLPAGSNQGRMRMIEAASALGADLIEQANERDIMQLYEWIVELGAIAAYDAEDVEQEPDPLDALHESDEWELSSLNS